MIGVKPGDHAFSVRVTCEPATKTGRCRSSTLEDPATGVVHHFRFCNGVPLNESNPDELVNVLEYWEIHPDGTVQHFSWITDFLLIPETVWDIMRGGRARWKIENETFNTLKNQGYHLEHNYGHGEQNLSVVLALMMMLAFLVDQVQQLCCPVFQAAWHKMKTKCHLWEEIRNHFRTLLFDSMADLLTALIRGIAPRGRSSRIRRDRRRSERTIGPLLETLNQGRVRGAQSAPPTGARLSNWGSFGLRQARLRHHFRLWKMTYHDLNVKMGESGRVRLKWPGIAAR